MNDLVQFRHCAKYIKVCFQNLGKDRENKKNVDRLLLVFIVKKVC